MSANIVFIVLISMVVWLSSSKVTKFIVRSIAGQDYADCKGDYYLDQFYVVNKEPIYVNYEKYRFIARQTFFGVPSGWFITSLNYAPIMQQETKSGYKGLGSFQFSHLSINGPIEQSTWSQIKITDVQTEPYYVKSVTLEGKGPSAGTYYLDPLETINTYFVYVNAQNAKFLAISGGSTWAIASAEILNQVRDQSFGLNNYAFASQESNKNGAVPIEQSIWADYTVKPTFAKA